jgi:hypothetical protein
MSTAHIIPPLYKYCNTASIDILDKCQLKVPTEFDDSSELTFEPIAESIPYIKMVTSRQMGLQPTLIKNTLDRYIMQNVKGCVLDKVGILCFSADSNNHDLWEHYASKHTGFLLGFNTMSEFFIGFEKVDYDNQKIIPNLHGNADDGRRDAKKWVLRKNRDKWEYQNEYRKIVPLNQTIINNSHIPPWHMLPIDPTIITSVTLGSKSTLKARINEILSRTIWHHISPIK